MFRQNYMTCQTLAIIYGNCIPVPKEKPKCCNGPNNILITNQFLSLELLNPYLVKEISMHISNSHIGPTSVYNQQFSQKAELAKCIVCGQSSLGTF